MKKNLLKPIFLLLCLFSFLHANAFQQSPPSLLCGVYQLEGSNPNSKKINYRGEVEIHNNGSNYILTWKIGKSQIQKGIGILKDHILSVAYYDLTGRGKGVVSYCLIGPGLLEGSWAGYASTSFGREWLIYKHPSLPKN